MPTHAAATLAMAILLTVAPLDSAVSQVRPRPTAPSQPATLARPAAPPDATAMLNAYREALSQPPLQRAVRASLQRQLRTNPPIALVDGYWVTVLDLAPIYRDRRVQAAIRSELPGATPAVLAADPGARLGLAFTPMDFADGVMGDVTRDITASVALDALENARTDEAISVTVVLISFGVGVAAGLAANAITAWWTREETPVDPNTNLPINHPQADPDGDGQPNASDHDDDNDGAPDSEDQHPHDPDKTMCPPELCGHRAVIAFETGITDQMLRTVLQAFGTATTPVNAASLGAVGRFPGFTLVFPGTAAR